ncbi:MAG TPA: G1 family glutamic endopeptidase [Streptosporangiaceae bacterium]|nr:G1 family glutamic endopeptidase [Streptosporangiaceae bacterium]
MRRLPRLTGILIGITAGVLSVGAFASAVGSPAVTGGRHEAASIPARIMPGHPLVIARAFGSASPRPVTAMTQTASSNWAGYVADAAGTRFRYVSAQFFVPYLNCSSVASGTSTYSAHWAGFDGVFDQTVEQAGIVANCTGPTPQYAAFYEKYPRGPVYSSMVLHAGDSVRASVSFSTSTSQFQMNVTDTSDGKSFVANVTCPTGSTCDRSSAEVISEAPTSSTGAILPLADFGAESFSQAAVTSQSGTKGGLRSTHWSTIEIHQVNGGGTVLDQPSALYQGTTFANYWRAQS